jgi:hemolysin III
VWGLCGAGAVFQLFSRHRHRFISTMAYVFLGWLIVVAFAPMFENVPHSGLWLLLAGGLCYTVGVMFYLWRRLRYHHAVWHTFVLGGSACHYIAVLLLLTPTR